MRHAIVLAGGKSERLGGDKALLPFRGRMLVEHGLECVHRVCDDVVIACKDEEQRRRLERFGECLVDETEGRGPLEGIHRGCARLGSGYAFVFGCDMPFLCTEAITFLFEKAEGHSAAIPTYGDGRFEPLHSVYKIEETLAACRRVSREKKGRIFEMIDLLHDVDYVPVQSIRALDPFLKTFVNINTTADLEEYG